MAVDLRREKCMENHGLYNNIFKGISEHAHRATHYLLGNEVKSLLIETRTGTPQGGEVYSPKCFGGGVPLGFKTLTLYQTTKR